MERERKASRVREVCRAGLAVLVAVVLTGVVAAQPYFTGLGHVPGYPGSCALDLSRDGSVVVGAAYVDASYAQAFRWTQATGMVPLGDLPGGPFRSFAYGASGDGSIVVGQGRTGDPTADGWRAFIRTAGTGMRELQTVLISEFGLGSDLGGWTLASAQAIDDDGMVIVGGGVNPSGQGEAWMVSLYPEPATLSLLALGGLALLRMRRKS